MISDRQLLQIKGQDVAWDNKYNYHHKYNTKYFLAILLRHKRYILAQLSMENQFWECNKTQVLSNFLEEQNQY